MFDEAFNYTMPFEGWSSCTNDPDDPGGLTKYGISKVNHPEVDVANLSLEGAKAIYRKHYWNPIKGDQIASGRVAIKFFDMAVNMGVKQATKLVQGALCDLGAHVEVDGVMGPKTLEKLNGVDDDVLFVFLVPLLEAFYRGLGKPKYIKGWLRRARTLPHVEG